MKDYYQALIKYLMYLVGFHLCGLVTLKEGPYLPIALCMPSHIKRIQVWIY